MKRLTFLMIFLMLGLVAMVSANEPIGVFANLNTNSIQLINPLTNESTGPLLAGDIGTTPGGLLDVAITSDGKTAIVSNFGDSKIFFIDISGGFNAIPKILGFGRTLLLAEDIAITPDDKYALVTDGAFSSQVAVIDIATHGRVALNNLGWRQAQAIAVTPDGQTVVVADYWGGYVHSYALGSDGTLTHKKSVSLLPFWPINVSISPDGRTVIVPTAFFSCCMTLYFDSEGTMHFSEIVAMPGKGGQSCVFNNDGSKAYYISNSQENGTMIIGLNVTGPGMVSPSGTTISLPRRGSGQYFGIDTIALDPSENYLYVSNPTSFGGLSGIAVVDLATNTKVDVIHGTGFPAGIAFTTIKSGE